MKSHRRSIYYSQLEEWAPILKISGTHFVNVQYGDCQEELTAVRELLEIEIHYF